MPVSDTKSFPHPTPPPPKSTRCPLVTSPRVQQHEKSSMSPKYVVGNRPKGLLCRLKYAHYRFKVPSLQLRGRHVVVFSLCPNPKMTFCRNIRCFMVCRLKEAPRWDKSVIMFVDTLHSNQHTFPSPGRPGFKEKSSDTLKPWLLNIKATMGQQTSELATG